VNKAQMGKNTSRRRSEFAEGVPYTGSAQGRAVTERKRGRGGECSRKKTIGPNGWRGLVTRPLGNPRR